MNRIANFLKSTKTVSRVLFFMWIFLSAISNFEGETRLQIILEYAIVLLIPAIIVEIVKNPSIRKQSCSELDVGFFSIFKHLSAGSLVLIFFWLFFVIFMSTFMKAELFGVAGVGFAVFCYFAISLFFLLPVMLIEYNKNPVLAERKKHNNLNRPDRYMSKSRIASIVFGIFAMIGGVVVLTGASEIGESLPPTILFAVATIVFGGISVNAPKTKAEAEERKNEKTALKEARRKQAEYEKRMSAYRGIHLTEQQIRQLENKVELPVVNTPVFLETGEVAVYYSVATRQETKNRVIGRTGGYSGGSVRIAKGFSVHVGGSSSRPVYGDVSVHYEGELVLTNKRLIFLSEQKGFEVPYNAITAATAFVDGLSIQSRSHTYVLLFPKADLAILAFNAVRTGELPFASASDHETIDCVLDDNNEFDTADISSIDGMGGHEFEYFCANLLERNGFSEVSVTKGSGDQGVDILATKGGIKYAIQCKNYTSPLSNTPVQEVNAGKTFYNCHVGVVMTNSTFTPGAKALAQATGVLLWDRSVVNEMFKNTSHVCD